MSKITYLDKQPLQDDEEIPAENKVTADDLNEIKRVVNANADTLETKQPKETGKGLSTNDFTDEQKEKLENLENYDDTEIQESLEELQEDALQIEEEEEVTIYE